MYWSRLSDHIGRKPVLLVGTFALAIATTSFGLSRAFWALVVRYHFPGSIITFRELMDLSMPVVAFLLHLTVMQVRTVTTKMQNRINGILGVIKSMVGEITDHTNSADAFALLHVPWAVGSSFG